MRIVGGEWRGLGLTPLGKGAPGLRPTADRVRESLFNVLLHRMGDPVEGAHVLDLFAGTGALGLEALSRGAERAVFVERNRAALELLRSNIARARAEPRAEILAGDATRLGPSSGQSDLVFLDPPYGKGLGERALASARSGGWIADGALIVWEEGREVRAPGFELLDRREYGGTIVSLLRAA